uniref:Uncharacterized protein n=1 Tax=Arundo donax TaxID=35708 RepID=A0A0A9GPZ1_ARUDO
MDETLKFCASGESTNPERSASVLNGSWSPRPLSNLDASNPKDILNLGSLNCPTETLLIGTCFSRNSGSELNFSAKLQRSSCASGRSMYMENCLLSPPCWYGSLRTLKLL